MALQWCELDLSGDPDEPEYLGDPSDLIDAASFVVELLRPPAWHTQAACAGRGLDAFYPGRGESLDPAREVCAGCEVQAECLAEALGRPSWADGGGVWGGTSERQRRKLRRASTDVDTAA